MVIIAAQSAYAIDVEIAAPFKPSTGINTTAAIIFINNAAVGAHTVIAGYP